MEYDDFLVYINGDFVRRSEAQFGLNDVGFRAGYVIYDTERTFDGKVYQLDIHLNRFWKSMKYVRLNPHITMDEMKEATLELAKRNDAIREPGDDYMISQIVTGGEGENRLSSDGKETPAGPTVIIWPDPMNWILYADAWNRGAHVVIPKTRSYSPHMLDSKLKHYSRFNMNMAVHEAHDVDPEAYALLTDMDGNISESTGSNFFIVTNGILKTPTDKSSLAGVSRMNILNLAKQLVIPTSVEDIQPYDVYTADEAFLTSTPHCLLPVGKADNREITENIPGPVTKQLVAAWSEMIEFAIQGQVEQQAKTLTSRSGLDSIRRME